ncbi:butyrophilin subfamily 1 member A1-like [Salarias fasciatus]|uniref:butyrophilin subfamily 1 member A1-like n=1 Tax=Salarias fasciatus TaxID=181472 RepID=UPI001176740F|nr:butyrophilin subfamily 1 member A1-like [Salarias fasciatus]
MVGPSTPVLAMLGVDVVLPCHLEPAADETKSTVEWSRSDLSPRFVHLRRDGVDLLNNQYSSYVGRTHLSSRRLKHGDLSLRLSNVKLSDEGKYSCIAPEKTSTEVHLLVGAAPPNVAVSAEADGSSGGVVLCCESAGWYPEPELLWLDSEGKLLSAGPPRTLRGPDGLYSVSSRVTVETRPSNTFSCRVQQSNISQSRTAQFSFEGDNKPQKNEEEQLVDQSSRTKDLEEENLRLNEELKKKQEEENKLVGVMEMLEKVEMEKWEEELKKIKGQKMDRLTEVEKMIEENKKKAEKLRLSELQPG